MKKFIKNNRVFIIAEAGVNHNGKLPLAKKLADRAKEAGCDAVKFQTFKAKNLVSSKANLAAYQKKNRSNGAKNQLELIKELELSFEDFKALKAYCDRKGILFLSTPFDYESVDLLLRLGVPAFKISSGEVNNIPFLQYVAGKRKPVILSTGMSSLAEVKEAARVILGCGNKDLILLHCTTEYPTPFSGVNLKAMDTLRKTFNVLVGYSDHTLGIEVAIAAAARGACVIEKHFTLNRNFPGPDHKSSLEPDELKKMVAAIRNVEESLGDGIKKPAKCEQKNIPIVRKSLVAAREIPRGEVITMDKIAVKRPGYGIVPGKINKVIGLRARTNIKIDEVITWELIA